MTSDGWLCALLIGAAVAVSGRRSSATFVVRGAPAGDRATTSKSRPRPTPLAVRRLAAAGAGLAAAMVVGGPVGLVVGVTVGLVSARQLGRLGTRAEERRASLLRSDLPLAADLLSAALASGATTAAAAGAVGRAIGGPLGAELTRVARACELGAPPGSAWARLLEEPSTAPLARPLVRAAERGSPAAAAAARVGSELRRAARDEAAAAAEAMAVRGVGPLGVCFLPGFVLLGVVPLVAGSALALLRQ